MGFEYVLTWISKSPARELNEIRLQKVQVIGYNFNAMPFMFSDIFRFRNVTDENFITLTIPQLCVSCIEPGMYELVTVIEHLFPLHWANNDITSKSDIDCKDFQLENQYHYNGTKGMPQMTRLDYDQYKGKSFPSNKLATIMFTFGFMILIFLLILGYYKRFIVKYYFFRMHQLFLCSTQNTFFFFIIFIFSWFLRRENKINNKYTYIRKIIIDLKQKNMTW